jgi:pSer/pThr/pTyr-binding forkhead associated (FHA) protein
MAVWVTLLLSQTDHWPVLAGRSNSCDLTLHSQAVSRRHAAFTRVRGCWYVSDLNSTNGTYIDEVRVERAPISSGTSLRLGDAFVEIA